MPPWLTINGSCNYNCSTRFNRHSCFTRAVADIIGARSGGGESMFETSGWGGFARDPEGRHPFQDDTIFGPPTQMTAIGNAWRTSLDLVYAGMQVALYLDEVQGKRLWLDFDGVGVPRLRLDDIVLATGTARSADGTLSYLFDHPYALDFGAYGDSFGLARIEFGRVHAINVTGGPVTRTRVEAHRARWQRLPANAGVHGAVYLSLSAREPRCR